MGIEEGGESCTFLKSFGHIFSKNSFGHYNAILRLACMCIIYTSKADKGIDTRAHPIPPPLPLGLFPDVYTSIGRFLIRAIQISDRLEFS